jgi:hypothetical protein
MRPRHLGCSHFFGLGRQPGAELGSSAADDQPAGLAGGRHLAVRHDLHLLEAEFTKVYADEHRSLKRLRRGVFASVPDARARSHAGQQVLRNHQFAA